MSAIGKSTVSFRKVSRATDRSVSTLTKRIQGISRVKESRHQRRVRHFAAILRNINAANFKEPL